MAALIVLCLASCAPQERKALDDMANGVNAAATEHSVETQALSVMEPLRPPVPGTPGGLPVTAPLPTEEAIDPASPEGAAQLVQGYYGLLEEKRFAEAQDLWRDGSGEAAQNADAFAARFAAFSEIHANIGAPGNCEGAAGSLFVTVPVQIYARVRATGKPYYALRSVVLRRVNDVPGSSDADRRWHIEKIGAYAPTGTSADPR